MSSHQGSIDWSGVKASGIEFTILRAGYGKFESQVDITFNKNAERALTAGLHVGAYWFSYALNEDDARSEARLCAEIIKPYKQKFDFPIFYDYEYDSETYSIKNGVTPTKELREALAKAFCEELQSQGWRAGVYTNNDYLRSRWSLDSIKAWEVWLADYTGDPDVACGLQQTSSTGRVVGISGNVDMDVSFKDYPSIIRSEGWNGFRKTETSWTSDTTNGVDNPVLIPYNSHYTVKITGEDIDLVCGVSGNLPAAFKLTRCRREGNATLWHVIPVGEIGQEAGIYPARGGSRIFVAKIT